MGVPLLWDLCPKNMVPQMAGCHQTGYRGFTLEKSLSKSPRHQRSVNRVNPGVATRKCSLAWQGLANSKRDGDFCALEEMAMGNQSWWSPKNSWMLDLYLQDEATAKSANNMTIWGCGIVKVKPLPDFGRNIDLPWFTIYFDVHQSIRVLTHSHMSMLRYVQICGRPYLSSWYT